VDRITFRAAALSDSAAVAGLVTQLGYPTTPAQMEQRLTRLLADPGYATVVAEASGVVVGIVGAYIGLALELDATYARLTGLVVDARWRGRGIGKALMQHIERWCREKGATCVILTSGHHRADAHKFYECIGYASTGIRFAKQL
jgi:GNAT superfamily N-acetyltransferase